MLYIWWRLAAWLIYNTCNTSLYETFYINYKSHNPSENSNYDYEDYENDVYWPNEGTRYGLDNNGGRDDECLEPVPTAGELLLADVAT